MKAGNSMLAVAGLTQGFQLAVAVGSGGGSKFMVQSSWFNGCVQNEYL